MGGSDQPTDPESPEQPASSPADGPVVGDQERDQEEPRAEEVEDLKVADEEGGEQVRGGKRLGQDMDPY